MNIGTWLRRLGLEQYEQAFVENAIDVEVLPRLTADDLKEMGVVAVGHRRKLLHAIVALRSVGIEEGVAPSDPVASADPSRRQVTVLFADLTGYTALSRTSDPEEVLAVLEDFFACVDRLVQEYGG